MRAVEGLRLLPRSVVGRGGGRIVIAAREDRSCRDGARGCRAEKASPAQTHFASPSLDCREG